MPKINYKIFDNINEIDKKDWDDIFGDIPENYFFYKTVENSELTGFKFFYLVIYRDDEIALIAPLFGADFNLDIALEGWGCLIIKYVRKVFPRFLIFKTIFCGSPFGEYGVLGVREGAIGSPELIPALLSGLNDLTARTGSTLIIFKDFLKQSMLFLDILIRYGYSKVESFPAVSLNLNFVSFEDYLKSLGKSTRKNLSKKLKQAYSRANIEVKVTHDAQAQIDRVVELYENTYRAGSTRFERLNRKFFLQVGRSLYPHTRFFLYYVDGKLAAFNLCFVYPDLPPHPESPTIHSGDEYGNKNSSIYKAPCFNTGCGGLLIDKFIGFDYDLSNYCNLYFVSWAHNIKFCIDNSLRFYCPGQTDYEPKIRLGGKLIPLYAYLKHKNLFFNFLLKLLIPFLKPDNFNE